MRDSVTYMAIVEEGIEKGREEGRVEGARKVLLRIGSKKLGTPSKRMISALDKIADEERLDRLAERIDEVSTWKDLLAE